MIDELIKQTVNRLNSLELFQDVLTADELSGLDEIQQQTPSANVIYGGITVEDTARGNRAVKVQDRITIVLTVRFNSFRAAQLYEEATPLIEATISALMGWTPDKWISETRFVGAAEPLFSETGFAYFPLEFEIGRVIKASNQQ